MSCGISLRSLKKWNWNDLSYVTEAVVTAENQIIMIRVNIDVTRKPTDTQLRMLKVAENAAPVFDEDSPRFTPKQLKEFRQLAANKKELLHRSSDALF